MHWLLVYSYVLVVSFGLALVLTPLFKRASFRWGFVDQPDTKRKFHMGAMPLLGGCAVFGAFAANVLFNYLVILPLSSKIDLPYIEMPDIQHLIGGAFSVWQKLSVLLLGGFLMIALGMADDKYELKPRVKLAAQFFIATIVWLAGMRIVIFVHHNPPVSYVVTVMWIVTITNAMNFLDNMDGLCAGIGVVASGLFAFIAGIQDQYFVCLLSLALAGALLGFLIFNFKPASIFLGDAGSHFVGYMLAVLPVIGTFYRGGDKPTWLPVLIPLLVLAVPLFDLVMVSWMRMRNGQPIYMGDVNHISHRLVRLGLPQSWAVTLIYLIALTLGLGATVLLWAQWTAAVIVIVQALCVLAIVTLLERLGRK
jgi:UDP-GlcNAc:undecaprenyl-phosphate/decaprenyl-phosphate GlcNAc-1-phosphate transferase